jgi:hypothetical protein
VMTASRSLMGGSLVRLSKRFVNYS